MLIVLPRRFGGNPCCAWLDTERCRVRPFAILPLAGVVWSAPFAVVFLLAVTGAA